jgi:hypothetical protein
MERHLCFSIGPGWPFPILVEELEISREPPTRVGLPGGVSLGIPLALALRAILLPPGSAK